MRKVTLIMAYYINSTMLHKQLEHMAGYPQDIKNNLEVIIVDDCSPQNPAKIHRDIGCRVRLYRTEVDVRWNQDFCRNLAASKAENNWLLLTDIDHMIPAETLKVVMTAGDLAENSAYKFSRATMPLLAPYKPHPNSWFLSKRLYSDVGGYDERLAGYYGTDGDFVKRLTYKALSQGGEVRILPSVIWRVPREYIPDASTTTLERKSEADKQAIKRIINQRGDMSTKTLTYPYKFIYDSAQVKL